MNQETSDPAPDSPARIGVVLVAAGAGIRAGGAVAKQWRRLSGRSVVEHAHGPFACHPEIGPIVMIVPPSGPMGNAIDAATEIVTGGETRAASVRAGLEALEGRVDLVLIHDAARPFVSRAVVDGVIAALADHQGAAPGLPVTDALWRGDHEVEASVPREGLFRAQTPQGFHLPAILAAHRAHDGAASDDVEIARAAGLRVAITAGEEANFKITHPEDFTRAERALKGGAMRIGTGFDVHRFGAGDHVTICGIEVPFDRGLQGHSDADVGMHAITDAIYGALAEGDIGQHFPPSDPQWKGCDSAVFLAHAVQLAAQRGFAVGNVDCTLICEQPKIGPHAEAMRKRLAAIMDLATDRISVKATTSEQLGFTGRGEGIAAQAAVLLEERS